MEPTTDAQTNGGGIVGSLAADLEESPAAMQEGEGVIAAEEKGEEGGEKEAPEPQKKKRGRPKGSKNRPKDLGPAVDLPKKKPKKAAPGKKKVPKAGPKKKPKKPAKAKAA